jgi:hypothetical protein
MGCMTSCFLCLNIEDNEEYIENKDVNARYGHKWSLKTLWAYLSEKGHDVNKIWEQIIDLVLKTIIR